MEANFGNWRDEFTPSPISKRPKGALYAAWTLAGTCGYASRTVTPMFMVEGDRLRFQRSHRFILCSHVSRAAPASPRPAHAFTFDDAAAVIAAGHHLPSNADFTRNVVISHVNGIRCCNTLRCRVPRESRGGRGKNWNSEQSQSC